EEALLNYIGAIDHLKAVADKLWLAAAYEGLCAASLALLFPKRWHYVQELRRRFPCRHGVTQDLLTRNDYETARTEIGAQMRLIASQDARVDENVFNNKTVIKNVLSVEQFYERFKEAASNYALVRRFGLFSDSEPF